MRNDKTHRAEALLRQRRRLEEMARQDFVSAGEEAQRLRDRLATMRTARQQADMEARGPNAETPLHAAAQSGHHEVVELLLDKGANGGAYTDGMNGTALHAACLYGRLKTVQLLLDRGSAADGNRAPES